MADPAPRADHPPHGNRLRFPFRFDGLERLEGDRACGGARRQLVHEHGPDRRSRLEPSCRVHDIAGHHPFAALGPRADRDDRLPRGHRRADGELEALFAQLRDGVENAKARPHRALGVVLVCDRCPEDGHDGVTDELLHRSAEALDVGLDPLVVRTERCADVLGVGTVRAIREPDEIDEENGHDLPLLTDGSSGRKRLGARQAEACALGVLLPAGGADDHAPDLRSAVCRRLRGRRERLFLVLGEPPLEDAPREDAQQAVVLVDDRNALGVLGLEKAERLLERDVRADREVRLLGDRAKLRLSGSSPTAMTARTRVLRVTTPTRRSSSVT